MAESKKRKNSKPREEDDVSNIPNWTDGIPLSPAWWAPTFIALLIIGLLWLVIYYFSGTSFPIPGIKHGNLAIGIVIMLAGFGMTLRWR